LKDYSFACRYNPYSNPGATLKPYVDNGEVVLRCIVTSNIYNQGLYTVVTDELEKYGAGVLLSALKQEVITETKLR